MLEQEKVMELKILNKQGQSMKAIARVSGTARNTVRKYVRDSATAVRKARISRLDLHRDWLIARLSQSPGYPHPCCGASWMSAAARLGVRDCVPSAPISPRAVACPPVRH